MLDKRPHTVTYEQVAGEATIDPVTGEWVETPMDTAILSFPCRAEGNAMGRSVPTKDGKNVEYSWKIFLDRNVPRAEYGTQVTVVNGDETIVKGTVIGFHRKQKVAIIWV